MSSFRPAFLIIFTLIAAQVASSNSLSLTENEDGNWNVDYISDEAVGFNSMWTVQQ